LLTAWSRDEADTWLANYFARMDRVPAWLLRHDGGAPATVENRECWPDHPYNKLFPITVWREPARW
jgi:hypothetical protein